MSTECSQATRECGDLGKSDESNKSCKQFKLKSFTVTYGNKCQIQESENRQTSDNMVVTNFMCQRVGDQILKRTEIRIGNQIIMLEDSYCFDLIQLPKRSESRVETECETKSLESSTKNQEEQFDSQQKHDKQDKKNVVKNIIKAFEGWLNLSSTVQKHNEGNSLTNSRKCLHRMITKVRFNNRLVNSILANQGLRPLFEEYLETSAEEWLSQSKIKDREAHQAAIRLYLESSHSGTALASRIKGPHRRCSDI